LPEGTQENDRKTCQDNRSPGRDLNL
jgi:hypothetical protein